MSDIEFRRAQRAGLSDPNAVERAIRIGIRANLIHDDLIKILAATNYAPARAVYPEITFPNLHFVTQINDPLKHQEEERIRWFRQFRNIVTWSVIWPQIIKILIHNTWYEQIQSLWDDFMKGSHALLSSSNQQQFYNCINAALIYLAKLDSHIANFAEILPLVMLLSISANRTSEEGEVEFANNYHIFDKQNKYRQMLYNFAEILHHLLLALANTEFPSLGEDEEDEGPFLQHWLGGVGALFRINETSDLYSLTRLQELFSEDRGFDWTIITSNVFTALFFIWVNYQALSHNRQVSLPEESEEFGNQIIALYQQSLSITEEINTILDNHEEYQILNQQLINLTETYPDLHFHDQEMTDEDLELEEHLGLQLQNISQQLPEIAILEEGRRNIRNQIHAYEQQPLFQLETSLAQDFWKSVAPTIQQVIVDHIMRTV